MKSELFGILGRALDPQNLQAESTSAAIDVLTKLNRFERMTSEQRAKMRVYYQGNIAMEKGKHPRPNGSLPMPWMLEEWNNDLNQLERVMKDRGEI